MPWTVLVTGGSHAGRDGASALKKLTFYNTTDSTNNCTKLFQRVVTAVRKIKEMWLRLNGLILFICRRLPGHLNWHLTRWRSQRWEDLGPENYRQREQSYKGHKGEATLVYLRTTKSSVAWAWKWPREQWWDEINRYRERPDNIRIWARSTNPDFIQSTMEN